MKTEEVEFREDICDSLKNIISSCLQRNPEDRIKVEDLIKHQAFEKFSCSSEDKNDCSSENKNDWTSTILSINTYK